jgi:hypothetical protein
MTTETIQGNNFQWTLEKVKSMSPMEVLHFLQFYSRIIGHTEEGQHPDEALPRAENFLKERANWEAEVQRLREHIDTQDMIIRGIEEGAEEWRMKCENLQVECDRLWQERNDMAQGKIDIRDDVSPHSNSPHS